jgi:hypothetical protein
MRRSDIRERVWNIPTEPGERANAEILQLPNVALDTINAQPAIVDNRYVFAVTTGNFSLSQRKEELDEKLRKHLPDMPQWQLHDLRRTAKTLMGQAGVRPDISERDISERDISKRVLGHAIPGVERSMTSMPISKRRPMPWRGSERSPNDGRCHTSQSQPCVCRRRRTYR